MSSFHRAGTAAAAASLELILAGKNISAKLNSVVLFCYLKNTDWLQKLIYDYIMTILITAQLLPGVLLSQ